MSECTAMLTREFSEDIQAAVKMVGGYLPADNVPGMTVRALLSALIPNGIRLQVGLSREAVEKLSDANGGIWL